MIVNITETLRLVRRDALNMELEEFRHPDQTRRNAKNDEPRWVKTGNYFQSLGSALRFVHDRLVRDDGGEYGLADAVKRCDAIARKLLKAKAVE